MKSTAIQKDFYLSQVDKLKFPASRCINTKTSCMQGNFYVFDEEMLLLIKPWFGAVTIIPTVKSH